jgi:putative FmdB family regulatory protein
MPIYEFRCAQCGHVQEILVSGTDSNPLEMQCNACQGEVLERVLSRVSYTMGSSRGEAPKATTKTCGPGKSCTTIDLPGYTR